MSHLVANGPSFCAVRRRRNGKRRNRHVRHAWLRSTEGGYGSGAAIGIGAGAAAGVGALYLVLHHRGAVTGCVRSTDDGMALVDDKRNKSYSIIPGGIALKPGERLQLRGKKSTNAGVANFQATKVVRDLGTCNAESAASSAHSSAQ